MIEYPAAPTLLRLSDTSCITRQLARQSILLSSEVSQYCIRNYEDSPD